MRRREFIELLGGAAAAWPLVVRAQQSDRLRRIAAIIGADDVNSTAMHEANCGGWVEGTNVRIDTRFGGGDANVIRKYAAELVALSTNVIVSTGGLTTELLLPYFFHSECSELSSKRSGCVSISEAPGDNIEAFNASAAPVAILNPSCTVPAVHIVELPAKAAQRHEHFDNVRKVSLD